MEALHTHQTNKDVCHPDNKQQEGAGLDPNAARVRLPLRVGFFGLIPPHPRKRQKLPTRTQLCAHEERHTRSPTPFSLSPSVSSSPKAQTAKCVG